jgi:hypothetical protein
MLGHAHPYEALNGHGYGACARCGMLPRWRDHAAPCPSIAPHAGRQCTLAAGHDGQHESGMVVWGPGVTEAAPKPPGFACDCGRRLPWPSRVQDETCPDCGWIWEYDGDDTCGVARVKKTGRDGACPASTKADSGTTTVYCDLRNGHPGAEHHAPGLAEDDPDITWTDETATETAGSAS